ncbi:MAG: AAA family ATPase [Ignavibacteria bacterium]|nr:AAA family ATPase [Ignavibacteria bacterium]
MTTELLSYFNLHRHPFTKEIDEKELVMFDSFQKTVRHVKILIEMHGIGVLTGKSGSGKSCIIRKVISELNPGTHKPVYLCHTSSSLLEFYYHLALALGIEPAMRKAKMFKDIKDRIIQLNTSHKIHPVLFIDEAHQLRNEILAELRLLLNFKIDSYHGMTVILCGQEELNMKFGLSSLESLANSVTMKIAAESLREDETVQYIEKRISDSGNSSPIFTKNAYTFIHQASGGNLRIIGNIASASLLKAFNMQSGSVEADHVKMVISR